MKELQEILDKLVVKENGCWEWPGARTTKGYGHIHWNGKVCRVHRVVYCIINGISLESEIIVMHKCDNPPCSNPEHLIGGNNADNTQDMYWKGRGKSRTNLGYRKGYFGCGHPYVEDNFYHSRGSVLCKICIKERAKKRRSEGK